MLRGVLLHKERPVRGKTWTRVPAKSRKKLFFEKRAFGRRFCCTRVWAGVMFTYKVLEREASLELSTLPATASQAEQSRGMETPMLPSPPEPFSQLS